MKIFNWIQANKYPLMVIAFFIVVALCVWLFFQGLSKDHSLDKVRMQFEYKEQERQKIIEVRAKLQPVIDSLNRQIISLEIRDSLLSVRSAAIDARIKEISKPIYVKEKIKQVESYSGNDLLNYLNKLPEPNDY